MQNLWEMINQLQNTTIRNNAMLQNTLNRLEDTVNRLETKVDALESRLDVL